MSSVFNINNYAGDGFKLIASVVAGGESTMEVTDLDDTYSCYLFRMSKTQFSTNNAQFRLRTSSDNGSTFDSGGSDYQRIRCKQEANAAPAMINAASSDHVKISASTGNQSDESSGFELYLYSPASSVYTSMTFQQIEVDGSVVLGIVSGAGLRSSTSGVNAIQVYPNNGTITYAELYVYGAKT